MVIHFGEQSPRRFDSVQDLLDSGKKSGFMAREVGSFYPWWQKLTVRFDYINKSQSFVEVQDVQVLVGWSARYDTYTFENHLDALAWGEMIHKWWSKFDGDEIGFLKQLETCKATTSNSTPDIIPWKIGDIDGPSNEYEIVGYEFFDGNPINGYSSHVLIWDDHKWKMIHPTDCVKGWIDAPADVEIKPKYRVRSISETYPEQFVGQ